MKTESATSFKFTFWIDPDRKQGVDFFISEFTMNDKQTTAAGNQKEVLKQEVITAEYGSEALPVLSPPHTTV